MKTLNFILCGFIILFLSACSSDNVEVKNGDFEELEVKNTLCRDIVSGRWLPDVEESYLTYNVDGKKMKVEIINYIADCGTEKVTVEAIDAGNNQIEVKLTQVSELSANCVCPMDVAFSLPNLKEGETYKCDVKSKSVSGKYYFPLVSFTFEMDKGVSGKVLLEE